MWWRSKWAEPTIFIYQTAQVLLVLLFLAKRAFFPFLLTRSIFFYLQNLLANACPCGSTSSFFSSCLFVSAKRNVWLQFDRLMGIGRHSKARPYSTHGYTIIGKACGQRHLDHDRDLFYQLHHESGHILQNIFFQFLHGILLALYEIMFLLILHRMWLAPCKQREITNTAAVIHTQTLLRMCASQRDQ